MSASAKGSAWVSTLCRHPPHMRVVRNIRAFIIPRSSERLMSLLLSEICCAPFLKIAKLGSGRQQRCVFPHWRSKKRAGPWEKQGWLSKALLLPGPFGQRRWVSEAEGGVLCSTPRSAATGGSAAKEEAEKCWCRGPEYGQLFCWGVVVGGGGSASSYWAVVY